MKVETIGVVPKINWNSSLANLSSMCVYLFIYFYFYFFKIHIRRLNQEEIKFVKLDFGLELEFTKLEFKKQSNLLNKFSRMLFT